MFLEIVLLALFFALGLGLQRRRPSERLRERAWTVYWWTVTPTLVFTAFTTIGFDRELGLALAAAVAASWLVIALGYAYARAVASERDERGALALGAGFPNTGFLGYPLAQLALGTDGLALIVLYDRLGWLVPSSAVSTVIARLQGRRHADERRRGRRLRVVLVKPAAGCARRRRRASPRRSRSDGSRRAPRARRGDFDSLDGLTERLLRFGDHYREIAKPFEWTFTRADLDRVLERIASNPPRLRLAA